MSHSTLSRSSLSPFSAIALAVATALAAHSLHAAVKTYDGEANNNTLSDPINWVGDVAPVAGDSLIFAGATSTSPTTNGFAANTVFTGITFNATAASFTIGSLGSPVINLGGDIADEHCLYRPLITRWPSPRRAASASPPSMARSRWAA